ncbi:hypothetical protein [Peribacillus sp. S4]|uniref:hypothetical protein n=1 Tax=Peribacillus sp. S4 TaxID=3384451 RepID=UPI0039895E39
MLIWNECLYILNPICKYLNKNTFGQTLGCPSILEISIMTIRIALLGFGIVGKGLAEILRDKG